MACEMRHVSFRNGSIDIAGNLRLPNGFDENETYAALVIVTPGSSVIKARAMTPRHNSWDLLYQ